MTKPLAESRKSPLGWMTIRDAAISLRKTSAQVYRLMELGILKGKRDGVRWVVAANDVQRQKQTDEKERKR